MLRSDSVAISTFQGKTNQVRVRLDFISTSNDGNKTTIYKLIRNASFTVTPTYTPINAALSVIEYNNTSTTNSEIDVSFSWEEEW